MRTHSFFSAAIVAALDLTFPVALAEDAPAYAPVGDLDTPTTVSSPKNKSATFDTYGSSPDGDDWYVFDDNGNGVVVKAKGKPKLESGHKLLSGGDFALAKRYESMAQASAYAGLLDAEKFKRLAPRLGVGAARLKEIVFLATFVEIEMGEGKIVDKRTGGFRALTEDQARAVFSARGLKVRELVLTTTSTGAATAYWLNVAILTDSQLTDGRTVAGIARDAVRVLKTIRDEPAFASVGGFVIRIVTSLVDPATNRTEVEKVLQVDGTRNSLANEAISDESEASIEQALRVVGAEAKIWRHPALSH